MSPQFDWRNLVNTAVNHEARANQPGPTEREVLLREVMRLRAQGLMPRDIATALGLNDADVHALIYGTDEAGSV
jgi:DNA-binding NarL/FixJ family response regulator